MTAAAAPAASPAASPSARPRPRLSFASEFDQGASAAGAAASGGVSPEFADADADAAAVGELFSTVLRWDYDALVARGGAAEAGDDGDPVAPVQDLKPLPLVFSDANVSIFLV